MRDTPMVPCALQAWQASEQELRGYLRKRLQADRDEDYSEDLLHEVFLRLMRQGGKFCEVDNARSWLFHVARNLLIDHQRRRHPTVELPDELAWDPPDDLAPVDSLVACLPRALDCLSPEDRDALIHCDLGGLTQAEYAAMHGLSLSGAKSRVQRARSRLRRVLVETCGVRFDADSGQVCCYVPPGGE